MKTRTIIMIAIGSILILATTALTFGYLSTGTFDLPLISDKPDNPGPPSSGPVSTENGIVRLDLSLDQTVVSPEDDDALLMVQVSAKEEGPIQRTPVSIALVLDASGSMAGNKILNAREAAHRFVDQLVEGDILSIISFDTSVITHLSGFVVTGDRTLAHNAVNQIDAGGGTCISCGLQSAYSLLSDAGAGRLRRVILLSDGNANAGISDVYSLERMVASYAESLNVATATIGLGRDHDERMLSAIATAGSANFYFLHNSGFLAQILDRELASLARTAVSDLTIELSPADGVTLLVPSNANARQQGPNLVISVGQIAAGEKRYYLVPVQLPPGDLSTVVSARAVFTPVNGTKQELSVTAVMERSDDPARVAASVDGQVVEREAILNSVAQIEAAMDAYEAGERDRAYTILQDNATQVRALSVQIGGSEVLAQEAEDLDGLLQALPAAAPGSLEERGNIMFNRARSADVQRGQSREEAYHQNGMYDLSITE